MKLYYIPFLLFILIFTACSDSNEYKKEEDIFDLEWNKDMDINKNEMFYVDSKGIEYTVNIENMSVILFPSTIHYMNIKLNNELFCFSWDDNKEELETGIVQVGSYGWSVDGFDTEYRGMLNILEISKGEWVDDTDIRPSIIERDIDIRATFHMKKETYKEGNNTEMLEYDEVKGIFYFSGKEQTGNFIYD